MKNTKKNRTSLYIVLPIFIVIGMIGIALMLLPQVEQHENREVIQQEVVSFREKIHVYREETVLPEITAPAEEPVTILPELYNHMRQYNEEIYEEAQKDLVDAFSYANPVIDLSNFGIEDGIVAVVQIPDINVEMPLYLGANWNNLTKGLAQLSQTSMPIGGENTNCVIAGHRGWYGVPFLRDIEMLEIGDSIYVETPWETLEYRVCEAPRIVLPDETENILIQEGRDLLTLLTCHPYAICTHRYLLICERYKPEEPAIIPETKGYWSWEWVDRVTITTSNGIEVESSQKEIFTSEFLPWITAISFLALLLLALLVLLAIFTIKHIAKKKNREKHH